MDENGVPLSGATISLTGSQSVVTLTDEQGNFRFSSLPTTGTYTVTASKRHYTFTTDNYTFVRPTGNVAVQFNARLNRYLIRAKSEN